MRTYFKKTHKSLMYPALALKMNFVETCYAVIYKGITPHNY